MSPARYKIYDDVLPYFITSSVVFGLPIFSNPAAAEIVIEGLTFLNKQRSVEITAWVLMENHIHVILRGNDLTVKIGRFKSYTARQIIDMLQQNAHHLLLRRLRKVKKTAKRDRTYQLWKEGYHPKQIIGDDMMIQKIEYIHNNPVKRGFVDRPEDWRYSSARDYMGEQGLVPVRLFGT